MEDSNNLVLFFEQNRTALQQFNENYEKLVEAIDSMDVKEIAFRLQMIRGIWHLVEGNVVNIESVIRHDNPAMFLLGNKS